MYAYLAIMNQFESPDMVLHQGKQCRTHTDVQLALAASCSLQLPGVTQYICRLQGRKPVDQWTKQTAPMQTCCTLPMYKINDDIMI